MIIESKLEIILKRGFCTLSFFIICIATLSCDCPVRPILQDAIIESDLIVTGRVLKIETIVIAIDFNAAFITDTSDPYFDIYAKAGLNKYTILVEKYFKGNAVGDTLTVCSFGSSGMCGYYFSVGGRYIIYSHEWTLYYKLGIPSSMNLTSSCNRTMEFSVDEEKDLENALRRKK